MNANALPALIKSARRFRKLFRVVQAHVVCPCCHQDTLALDANKRLCLTEDCQAVWA